MLISCTDRLLDYFCTQVGQQLRQLIITACLWTKLYDNDTI